MSGMRKLVRTPPMSIDSVDSRGKPFASTPVSQVVPPTSITMAFSIPVRKAAPRMLRSEEHTSELQSLMRNSYAVFCLKKKKKHSRYGNIHAHNNITELSILDISEHHDT